MSDYGCVEDVRDETGFRDLIAEALLASADELVASTETFQEAQVMTSDTGLVVYLDNGAVFHVTVQLARVPN